MARTATAERATRQGTRRSRLRFWVRRYVPAELASVTGLLLSARLADAWSLPAPALAILATVISGIGFYGVLAIGVHAEQRRGAVVRPWRRTLLLLIAEFGPAELLDSLLVRPVAIWLTLGLMPHAGVAVIVGKVGADLVFYATAAAAFQVTVRAGLRGRPVTEGQAGVHPPVAARSPDGEPADLAWLPGGHPVPLAPHAWRPRESDDRRTCRSSGPASRCTAAVGASGTGDGTRTACWPERDRDPRGAQDP